jgi:Polycystin cation channel
MLQAVRQLRYVRPMTTFSYTLKASLPVLILAFVVFGIITVGYSLLGTLVSASLDVIVCSSDKIAR